jgi:GNAT superfamily N-acetyltransferase
MTTAPALDLRTFTTLDTVRGDLIDVYADVRAPLLHLPNYAVTAFGERLDRHGTEPGFTAVLAYADGHPVGYAYGNTILHGDRYWQRTSPAPAAKYTERAAVARKEIGVRPAWRKTGTARRIHDALLATREEPFVTLMVNPAAGDGKVHALYTSWGVRGHRTEPAVTGLAGPHRDDPRQPLTGPTTARRLPTRGEHGALQRPPDNSRRTHARPAHCPRHHRHGTRPARDRCALRDPRPHRIHGPVILTGRAQDGGVAALHDGLAGSVRENGQRMYTGWEAAAAREGIEMFTGFDSSTGTESYCWGCDGRRRRGLVLRPHRCAGFRQVEAALRR